MTLSGLPLPVAVSEAGTEGVAGIAAGLPPIGVWAIPGLKA